MSSEHFFGNPLLVKSQSTPVSQVTGKFCQLTTSNGRVLGILTSLNVNKTCILGSVTDHFQNRECERNFGTEEGFIGHVVYAKNATPYPQKTEEHICVETYLFPFPHSVYN